MMLMKEDYLKIIFELGGGCKKVFNKEIFLGLGIVVGFVIEMIIKLVDEGFVEYEFYVGIVLIEKGGCYVVELVCKYCLWEIFLVDKFYYNMIDVYFEVEILEYKISDYLVIVLDDFLGYLVYCLYGGVIFSVNGCFINISYCLLVEGEDGEEVIIECFLDNYDFLIYFSEIGLWLCDYIKIVKYEFFEGLVVVE